MLSSDEEGIPNEKSARKKIVINKKTSDALMVKCEWIGCGGTLNKGKNLFYDHVSYHLRNPQDILGIDEFEEEIYKCRWSTCNFETKDPKEITRHLKYHAHHAELRALGSFVSKILKLPPCLIQNEFKVLNNVDDSPLICGWNSCSVISAGIQEFLDHVHYHTKSISTNLSSYDCLWVDCSSSFQSKSKLTDHLKTHTKQHFIACSQCGHTFANKTKFVDHCLTQKPIEEHVYQCDYCLTFHPSERILRKHMGQHIHHYKCCFCNMTCNKPSLLAKHIRYRHLKDKAFKCSLCDYKCKSKSDLQSHVLRHVKGLHPCQDPGCGYVTRSQHSLKRHMELVHPREEPRVFSCHICDKKYRDGCTLTKHLASKHNLKKPNGYTRFQYRLEGDGLRRLQSVRLESFDIADIVEDEDSVSSPDEDPLAENKPVCHQAEEMPNAITVDVIEGGEVVSSSVVIPEESLPPEDAEIIAVGE